MIRLSEDKFEILCIKIIQVWRRKKTKTVTMDAKIYKEYFSFLQPIGMIIDSKNTDKILFVQLNREEAIKAIEHKKELHYGPQVCRNRI
jgi:hypothetical protein